MEIKGTGSDQHRGNGGNNSVFRVVEVVHGGTRCSFHERGFGMFGDTRDGKLGPATVKRRLMLQP